MSRRLATLETILLQIQNDIKQFCHTLGRHEAEIAISTAAVPPQESGKKQLRASLNAVDPIQSYRQTGREFLHHPASGREPRISALFGKLFTSITKLSAQFISLSYTAVD